MKHYLRTGVVIGLAACCVNALAVTAAAQTLTAPLQSEQLEYVEDSGSLTNDSREMVVVYSTTVTASGAPWMRVGLRDSQLAGRVQDGNASYLVLTSLLDGAQQIMNARHLEQWGYQSAYFNGDAVHVELVAGPEQSGNRLRIDGVEAGLTSGSLRTICGTTDDRELSYDDRIARVEPVGCTVWMIDDVGRQFLTAGHCAGSGLQVVEYNVPLSGSGGGYSHPPPSDQYPVDPNSLQYVNGGTGDDWAYFGCFENSTTGLTAFEAQGAFFTLVDMPPSLPGPTIRITGYGTVESPVSPTWNGVQKTHTGPYSGRTLTRVAYRVDTTGGNSGSPIINDDTQEAIGIHAFGGCTETSGANHGTGMNHAGLRDALANPVGVCAADCNGNGVLDSLDLAMGTSSDCDGNGTPDYCDLQMNALSGRLSPIGTGYARVFTIVEASPAYSDVTLTLHCFGDFGGAGEYLDVSLNGNFLARVFQTTGTDCPETGYLQEVITLDAATFNSIVAGGDAEFTLAPSAAVDPYSSANACVYVSTFISAKLQYAATQYDCNSNGVPDNCDAAAIVTGQPADSLVCPGGVAHFSVAAPTADGYQWKKNDIPLTDDARVSGSTSPTLTIENANPGDQGVYSCEVTSGCLVTESQPAALSLYSLGTISEQPAALVERCLGGGAVMSIGVTDASPAPDYQWYENGQPLSNGGRYSGVLSAELFVNSLTFADQGNQYTCVVSNTCGFMESDASIVQVVTPQFDVVPEDDCEEVGGTIVLTAEATSTKSIFYQWRKGAQTVGAGEVLTLNDVTSEDAGQYYVVAFTLSPTCSANSDEVEVQVGDCPACAAPGDADGDGDYDLADMQLYMLCYGASVIRSPECACANVDTGDWQVTEEDWAALSPLITGPQ